MAVRALLVTCGLLFSIATVSAESHPAWWRYASADATALVGIHWDHVRSSIFAEAITGELSGEDGLGFPDLDCLKQARQILISSPVLLAMASGEFPAEVVLEQATAKKLKRTLYHEIEIWVTPGKDTLSIARMSDQLALLGRVKDLKDAIDRSLMEESDRTYSPLLARGARYAQDDLWVIAARLPDDLAERFVPIDAEADGFEGTVSVQGGLKLKAVFIAPSEEAADHLVETLKKVMVPLPVVTQGIEIRVDQNHVALSLSVSEAQLAARLKPTVAAMPEPVKTPEPAKAAGPQIIRIFGLDDGPREIVMR